MMPKNEPKISDCEISQLRGWINDRGLDNEAGSSGSDLFFPVSGSWFLGNGVRYIAFSIISS
jgi:hypothetical protein